MAEEKRDIILNFEVEQGDAIAEQEKLKKAFIQLKKEQQDLQKAFKTGAISLDEYAKETVRVDNNLKVVNKQLGDTQKQVTGVKSSFDKLNESNKSIADSLKRLDFAGVKDGIVGATRASLAFIATPIGAVIAALGVAVAALTAYFKGSEEGQTRFNRIMNIGSAIIGKFTDLVRFLGEKVFDTLVKGGEEVIKFLERFVPGFKEAEAALARFLNLDVAAQISALEEERIALNRRLIVRRDELKAEIEAAKLRAEATKNIKERTAALNEATEKINELAQNEKRLAQIDRDIAVEKAKLADNTIEDNDKIAEAQARINQVERERLAQLKEITTKQLALSEQDKKEREAREIEQQEIDRQRRIRLVNEELAAEQQKEDIKVQIQQQSADKQFAITQKLLSDRVKVDQKEIDLKRKKAKEEETISFLVAQTQIQNAINVLQIGSQLLKEGSAGAKAAAIAITTAQTISAATAALAPPPTGVGPVLGPFLATITTAVGLRNAAKIAGLNFAAGGGSFLTKGPQILVVGDNPGGVERVDVTPISGRGKTTVGDGMIKMAGGGSIVANAASSDIDRRFNLSSAFQNAEFFVSWREGMELGKSIKFKEQVTSL